MNWFSHDVHTPWAPVVHWPNGSIRHFSLNAVGGLHIDGAGTSVTDSYKRPFISCGSPTFSNGSKFIDHMPQVIQNISFEVSGTMSTASPPASIQSPSSRRSSFSLRTRTHTFQLWTPLQGTITNTANSANASLVCAGDLGPVRGPMGYAARQVTLDVTKCNAKG